MAAYYNEFDPYAAQWLRNLIKRNLIADGEVDERSITEVQPEDLEGFTQCHFFAGIGGWSLAARLVGWSDDRQLWTGSAPCQPFSTAGNQKGQKDERHLWPKFFDLIRACKPTTIMGEQVSAAIRFGWLDGVSSDLEGEGYTTGAVIIPACAVNAPHKRDRLWFVADYNSNGCKTRSTTATPARHWNTIDAKGGTMHGVLGYTKHDGQSASSQSRGNGEAIQHNAQGKNSTCKPKRAGSFWDVPDINMAYADNTGLQGYRRSFWQYDAQGRQEQDGYSAKGGFFINCPDGKSRRIEPRIPLLVDGLPARMVGRSALSVTKRRKGVLSGLGNAIVPQVAAEIIKAYMETRPE